MDAHNTPLPQLVELLTSSKEGLSSQEAQTRLARHGKNEIKSGKKQSVLLLFLAQFSSPVVWILIGAVIVSFFLNEIIDAQIILFILIVNACIGFFQEYKAEKAIEALQKLAAPKAKVLRNGVIVLVDASTLVPGDILVLQEGDKVTADARLIISAGLLTQESALTGESTPIEKRICEFTTIKPIGDQANMVFSGTLVVRGDARALVAHTGMNTEIGKIAHLLQDTTSPKTPLQIELGQMGKSLGAITLLICILIFVARIAQGEPVLATLIMAVALAVAAIPEGLPAVVTVALSLGVNRMLARHALIRKLPSVETLGAVTVICTDKTGTLTHNEMTVRKLFVNRKIIDVQGSGYDPGSATISDPDARPLLEIGILNNGSTLNTG